ncbi:hypothetical protein Q31a_36070 [Aureliella helgolandensis]|uniref:Uncharacterized protein n=1 Tax=Aureliella helgolandensis TaxID=2527968 RepID=A0A518G9N8_9BACT|nr:hypothetical protein Q31a_36070 [Aureliella helgolandensis]
MSKPARFLIIERSRSLGCGARSWRQFPPLSTNPAVPLRRCTFFIVASTVRSGTGSADRSERDDSKLHKAGTAKVDKKGSYRETQWAKRLPLNKTNLEVLVNYVGQCDLTVDGDIKSMFNGAPITTSPQKPRCQLLRAAVANGGSKTRPSTSSKTRATTLSTITDTVSTTNVSQRLPVVFPSASGLLPY